MSNKLIINLLITFLVLPCIVSISAASEELVLPEIVGEPDIVSIEVLVSVEDYSKMSALYEGALLEVTPLSPGENLVILMVSDCYANESQPSSPLLLEAHDYLGEIVDLSLVQGENRGSPIQQVHSYTFSENITPVIDVEDNLDNEMAQPSKLSISVAPNPFNPSVEISFSGKPNDFAVVSIYDIRGRLVDVPYSTQMMSNEVKITWHGKSSSGETVSSGVYFVRVFVAGQTDVVKIVLAK